MDDMADIRGEVVDGKDSEQITPVEINVAYI